MRLRDRLAEGARRIAKAELLRRAGSDRFARLAFGLASAGPRLRAARAALLDGDQPPAWMQVPGEDEGDGYVAPPVEDGAGRRSSSRARSLARHEVGGRSDGAGSDELPRPALANGARSANGSHAGGPAGSGGDGLELVLPAAVPHANGAQTAAHTERRLADEIAARAGLSSIGGRDVFEKAFQFVTAQTARAMGIYPFFRPLDSNSGPEVVLDGKTVTMLGSNNYLGLTTHPAVREAARRSIERYGTSMTGSRLVNGTMRLHNELEEKLAAFHGREAALVFTTGYQVNLATLSALLSNRSAVAVIDKEVHASIYDGVRLALAGGARMVRYRHNDPESLDRALARLGAGEGALVVTDGVFSAHGEIARLPGLVEVARRRRARLFVDDAHGLGVLGPGGRGTAAHFGLAGEVDLLGGTFSKSLASNGGWLVGDRRVLDYIQHFAPAFLFAASAAPPCVAAAMAALEVMQAEPWRQEQLRKNFTYMREELRRLGFDLGRTETAVIPIYVRDDLKTMRIVKTLIEEHAIYTNAFITPGVAPRQQVLRTSYMATHEQAHLDRALEALAKVGRQFGLI